MRYVFYDPMMDYHQLVQQLTDPATRDMARDTLLRLDEAAVEPLVDQFYAGVNEATGLAILEILATIGGYEALLLMQDVHLNGAQYPAWAEMAVQALKDGGWL
ncbi:MAG: hypothetical protein OHK0046_40360 [Anaerolineae bacterium]